MLASDCGRGEVGVSEVECSAGESMVLGSLMSVRDLETYRGPICPPLSFAANSMCIRVTSRGRTAAPGPVLMFRSWKCQWRRSNGLEVIVKHTLCILSAFREKQ